MRQFSKLFLQYTFDNIKEEVLKSDYGVIISFFLYIYFEIPVDEIIS